MASRVRTLVLGTTAAAIVVIAAVFSFAQIQPDIGGPPGIVFWTVATLLASALPVVLPRGVVVSVSAAPVLAATVLGGPAAGAIVFSRISSWRTMAPFIAAGSCSHIRVDPSRSVRRKVTVPDGGRTANSPQPDELGFNAG